MVRNRVNKQCGDADDGDNDDGDDNNNDDDNDDDAYLDILQRKSNYVFPFRPAKKALNQ
jgi:hypothetical protein